MKKYFLPIATVIIQLALSPGTNAQLTVGSGTYINQASNANISLQNMDLVNNGTITFSGLVKFTGNANNNVRGASIINFNKLEIAKNSGSALSLSRNISVSQNIQFTSGILDLNNQNIILSPGAVLLNENETSRIIGSNGGYVSTVVNMNVPSLSNPGNLGAIISSSQNLGSVTIQRGHKTQSNVGGGNSILRYYDILPTNNSLLNATLRFTYFDAELNGNSEATLSLYKSVDNVTWSSQTFTSRDASANYVEKTGINDFSRWTLRSSNSIIICDFVFYRDADGDGYGDPVNSITGCEEPAGYVANHSDCDDTNASVHPRAAELCGNLIDDNCNDQTDEDCTTSDPAISINDITVNESQGTAQLTVSLSSPSVNTVRASFRTVNGTASHPKDYTRSTGEVVFAPGSTTQTINITIIADNKAEPDEYFDVELHSPVGATITDINGRVTITESLLTRLKPKKAVGDLESDNKDRFDVKVSSNPTHTQFRLDVETNKNELLTIQVTDIAGRIIQRIQAKHPIQPIYLGTTYRPGIYFAQVIQGTNSKTVKLIKF